MTGRRLLPLSGAAAVLLLLAAHILHGSIPHVDASRDAAVAFYRSNGGRVWAGSLLFVPAAFLVLLYTVVLRERLPDGIARSFGTAGGVLVAAALGLMAGVGVALGDAADEIDPVAVQALHAFFFEVFAPLGLGAAVLLVGYGVAAIHSATLPAWLGWVALPFGVVALAPEPLGDVAVVGLALWILATGVTLVIRGGSYEACGSATVRAPRLSANADKLGTSS